MMTTTDECVELYRLFVDSGLSPDEAAELVDGIARLSQEQRRELSKKLSDNQKAWAVETSDLSQENAQATSSELIQ